MENLTPGEQQTATWLKLREGLQARLAEAREKLEAPTLTHDQNQVLKGRVLEMKWLLSLEKDEPAIEEIVI